MKHLDTENKAKVQSNVVQTKHTSSVKGSDLGGRNPGNDRRGLSALPGHSRSLWWFRSTAYLGEFLVGTSKCPVRPAEHGRSGLNWKDLLDCIHGSERCVCSVRSHRELDGAAWCSGLKGVRQIKFQADWR